MGFMAATSRGRERMGKSQIKNLALVITSFVLSLAVFIGLFEIIADFRYEKWKAEFEENGDWYGKLTIPSKNEILMWEYRASSVGHSLGATIRTNKHGFRDRDHPHVKNKGNLRVAFVGDSVTLGIGVEEEDTFVRVFEHEAGVSRLSFNVEAMSFAVDGYNAIQVLELLRDRVLPFTPDIIVYVMCMNDFDFVRASGKKGKYFNKPDSFFLRALDRVFRRLSGKNYYEYFFHKNKEIVFSEILKQAASMNSFDIEFRVALVPMFRGGNFKSEYLIPDMHKEIATTLIDNDVTVIDLLAAFTQEISHPSFFALDEIHMNAEGHRLVAGHFIDVILGNPASTAWRAARNPGATIPLPPDRDSPQR